MSTRERLLAAAEELYGGQGIDAVSLREIQRASGVKNATALQYHFGDRAGLLTAVLEKHSYDVELRRHALLDRYEAAGDQNVRALAEALVQPLASKLTESTGGCAYLCIYADVMNRRQPILPPGDFEDHGDSIVRWRQLVDPFLDRTAAQVHRRLVVIRFVIGELARRAATAPHTDDRVFISQLIDLVVAMLTAAASPETRRIAESRGSG
jgi:AcrR family transcriptional regulator